MSKKEFTVTKEMIIAVNKVKDTISNAMLLVHPIRNAVLSITTDASDTVIAGVLHQHHRGRLQPLSIFSHRLIDPESRYSTTMCKKLHISLCTTTSYHPESNGMIKRVHRTLKASLRAECQYASWTSELPLILLGLWSAP